MSIWITSIIVILLAISVVSFSIHAQPPKLMLASKADHSQLAIPIGGYWLSEKYDGVRVFWTGKELLTRQGNKIHAPTWFINGLPKQPLDGELWLGRGKFELTSALIRTLVPVDESWKKLNFMAFDLPKSILPFELRQAQLQQLKADNKLANFKVVKQLKVENDSQIQQIFSQIINAGGEGVMLRRPQSYYDVGRSNSLIKLKKFDDDEAVVLEHLEGEGKLSGIMGSVLVQNRDGKTFKIGSGFSLKERKSPPEIGAIISYRYTGFTNSGIPRFATFIRERTDLNEL